MKSVKVYVREKGYSEGNGGSFIEVYEWDQDHPKEWFLKFKDNIIAQVKRNNPTAEFIDIEVPITNYPWTKQQLQGVGDELASTYGGVCTGFKVYPNHVTFKCKEFDEDFETVLTYDEVTQNIP